MRLNQNFQQNKNTGRSGGLLGFLAPNKNRFLLFGILSMMAISSNTAPIIYLSIFSNLFLLLYLYGRAMHMNPTAEIASAVSDVGDADAGDADVGDADAGDAGDADVGDAADAGDADAGDADAGDADAGDADAGDADAGDADAGDADVGDADASPRPRSGNSRVVIWQDLVLVMALLVGSSFNIPSALGSAVLVLPPSITLFVLYSRGVYNLFLPLIVAAFSSLAAFYGSIILHGYDDLIAGVVSYVSVDALATELGIGVDAVYVVLRIVINMAVVFNGVTYMYMGGLLYSSLLASGRIGFWLGRGTSAPQWISSTFLIRLSRNQSYALLSVGLALFFMATKIPVLPPMLAYALLAVPLSIFFYIGLDTLRAILFTNRPYALPKIFVLIILSIMGLLIVIAMMSLLVGILSVWVNFDRWVAQPPSTPTATSGGGFDE